MLQGWQQEIRRSHVAPMHMYRNLTIAVCQISPRFIIFLECWPTAARGGTPACDRLKKTKKGSRRDVTTVWSSPPEIAEETLQRHHLRMPLCVCVVKHMHVRLLWEWGVDLAATVTCIIVTMVMGRKRRVGERGAHLEQGRRRNYLSPCVCVAV